MHITRQNRFRYLIPILLLAFGLRVWGLAEHNIWWDEGIGVWVARLPVLEGIRWTATDSHPPLHYVILHFWRLIAGEGETILRFPSVVAGFFTILFAYRLGRRLGGERTGILTALFVAVSRFSIMWSQEIRMYGLSATLATGSLAAAAWMWRVRSGEAGEQRSRGRLAWLAYVGATLGGLYTLYLTGTVVLVTNLGFLIVWWREKWNRKLFWTWASAQIVTAVLFLPWVLYALPRMHSLSTDEPFKPGFFLQLYATMLTVGTSLNLERTMPLVITVVAGLALGIILIQHRITHRPTPVHTGGLAMMLGGLLLPPLAVVLVSLPSLGLGFSRSVAPRYLLPLSVCYAVLLAWGIDTLVRRASELTQSRKDAKDDTQPDSEAWLWRGLAIGVAGFALVAAVAGLWRPLRRPRLADLRRTLRGTAPRTALWREPQRSGYRRGRPRAHMGERRRPLARLDTRIATGRSASDRAAVAGGAGCGHEDLGQRRKHPDAVRTLRAGCAGPRDNCPGLHATASHSSPP